MKILVSSCLLGEDVRYDGLNSSVAFNPKFPFSLKELFMDILCENEIYSFFFFFVVGLGISRNTAEIVKNEKPFKILDNEQNDVTINFLLGAKKALDTCKNANILVALLKSKSPSCSNKEIHDGAFSNTLAKD